MGNQSAAALGRGVSASGKRLGAPGRQATRLATKAARGPSTPLRGRGGSRSARSNLAEQITRMAVPKKTGRKKKKI